MATSGRRQDKSRVLTKKDLPFLARNFKKLAYCWYYIGLNLEIPAHQLDCIKNPNQIRAQHKQYLIRALQKWVDKAARQATWRKLHEAAIAIEQRPVADRIAQEHKNHLDEQVNINNIRHVMTMLEEVVVKWRQFCIQLIPQISEADIMMIAEQDNHDNYLTQMFSKWIETKPKDATIDKLVEATRDISNDLTTKICNNDEMKKRYPDLATQEGDNGTGQEVTDNGTEQEEPDNGTGWEEPDGAGQVRQRPSGRKESSRQTTEPTDDNEDHHEESPSEPAQQGRGRNEAGWFTMGMIFIGGSLVLQYYKMIDGTAQTILLGVGILCILKALGIDIDTLRQIMNTLRS